MDWKNWETWIKNSVIVIVGMLIILIVLLNIQRHWVGIATLFETPVVYTDIVSEETRVVNNNITLTKTDDIARNYIVDMINDLQPRLDVQVAKLIAKSAIKHSKEFGFPPELIIAIISRESAFNTLAISSADCLGLMQVNPKAHSDKTKKLGWKRYDLFKIDNNILLGCMILREYYNSTKNIRKALKRYVGGNETQYVLDILGIFANSQVEDVEDVIKLIPLQKELGELPPIIKKEGLLEK